MSIEDYIPCTFVLIEWPFSKKIMNHPEAKLVMDNNNPKSFIIPISIWNKYKDSSYFININDFCFNKNINFSCYKCGNYFKSIKLPCCQCSFNNIK